MQLCSGVSGRWYCPTHCSIAAIKHDLFIHTFRSQVIFNMTLYCQSAMIANVVPLVLAFMLAFNPFIDAPQTICLILWSVGVFNLGVVRGVNKGTWLSQERMRELQQMEGKKWHAAHRAQI